MSKEQPQNERRQSHRFAVSDVVRGELVIADRSRWPVRLLDQSAGGFAVLADGPTPISCGEMAQLRTDALCSNVRVVSVTEFEFGDGGDDASAPAPRFRLGLARLGDLAIPPDGDERGRRWLPWRPSLPANPGSRIALVVGLFVVPFVAMTVLAILFSISPVSDPSVYSTTGNVRFTGQPPSTRSASRDSVEASDEAASKTSVSRSQVELMPDDLKHLPGALPFVTAGVIRELQLTNAQLEKIRGILNDTSTAIRENAESRLIFDSAQQEALNLLNDEQRRRWKALSSRDKHAATAAR